ncbi:RNA-directed DNA polymerase [Williamsia limnetica]|uniref:RNA-directed DNA polymerase n=1 Tax=Williamsia limnetica TaxID=882452 RepID=A0A318RX87_WILLI|nr:reverse transcriptase family protein [Williamsia limnetica]PYE14631.1 RNA-directed DNA polymerase [Williamsia limnetica]
MTDSYSLGGLGPRLRLTAESVEHLMTRLEVDPRWTVSALVDMLVATMEQTVVTELLGVLLDRFPERPTDLAAVRTFLTPLIGAPRRRAFEDPDEPIMRFELPQLRDYSDVARWLNLTVGELEWFADRGHWLRTKDGPLQHYRYWQVPKRDGVRMIEAPKPHLREIQRRLLSTIVDHIPPHRAAQGFVPGTSTSSFAWPHTDRPVVVRIDLRDCFSSIGIARVRAIFAAVGYQRTARVLAELCTTTTPITHLRDVHHRQAALLRQRHLPQGAPTSPALANLVMRAMDRRIWGYARRNSLHYSRYGDDLGISGDNMNPEAVLWVVQRIIADEGFTVHPDKTKIMRAHQRQQLAGLVVNDQPSIARRDYDNLRALLHNAIRTGAQAQNRSAHPNFRAHVRGKIAWIGATSTQRRNILLALAEQVDWDR